MNVKPPKRPLTSYMLFLNDHREQIKQENVGIKITEIAKRGGELWRALEDKSMWNLKAAEAKDRYTLQMKEFEVNGESVPATASRKRKIGGQNSNGKKNKNT